MLNRAEIIVFYVFLNIVLVGRPELEKTVSKLKRCKRN